MIFFILPLFIHFQAADTFTDFAHPVKGWSFSSLIILDKSFFFQLLIFTEAADPFPALILLSVVNLFPSFWSLELLPLWFFLLFSKLLKLSDFYSFQLMIFIKNCCWWSISKLLFSLSLLTQLMIFLPASYTVDPWLSPFNCSSFPKLLILSRAVDPFPALTPCWSIFLLLTPFFNSWLFLT